MKQQKFGGIVLDSKILTHEEVYDVVKYLNSVLSTPAGFPGTKRLFRWDCCRFESVEYTDPGYPYLPGKKDCLIFTVNKDIFLYEIRLCGSENSKYSVNIHIEDVDSYYGCPITKSGIFSSVLIKSEPLSYYGFNIFFDNPVVIKRGNRYRIEASISGQNSCCGQNGQNSVICSGVKFDFKNISDSTSGTTIRQGQFPALLFTVR